MKNFKTSFKSWLIAVFGAAYSSYADIKPEEICDHLWIEWEHFSHRKRKEFIRGTARLKNPECYKCGVRKYK